MRSSPVFTLLGIMAGITGEWNIEGNHWDNLVHSSHFAAILLPRTHLHWAF